MKVTLQDGQSLNIQQENIEALQQLFPELVRDGKVNFDVFRQIFGDLGVLEEGEEKFGLNWHGKKKPAKMPLHRHLVLYCHVQKKVWIGIRRKIYLLKVIT